jgi:crossover junction endodeoxyribonuclease RuvC
VIVGIDPGAKGALAFLDDDGTLLDAQDMPLAGGEVSEALIANALRMRSATFAIAHAYVERVHSMPKQGVTSTFTFGTGYGLVRGVLAGLGIGVTLVPPQEWKRAMRLPKGADKEVSRLRALQIWPARADLFALKKHEARGEAALIALYGSGLAQGERGGK